MNAENLTELLFKGFRVTLGATSSLIEILQDPYKRNENFEKIKFTVSELTESPLIELLQDPYKRNENLEKIKSTVSELTDEWAEKGQVTEREARNFVDTILSQRSPNSYSESTTVTTSPSVPTSIPITSDPEPVREIQELTSQLAELKDELKRLQDK